MNEAFIRVIADRFGLDVLRRVVTGNESAGFANFEITGPPERLNSALGPLKDAWSEAPRFVNLRTVNNPAHPGHGRERYIEIESVYFNLN